MNTRPFRKGWKIRSDDRKSDTPDTEKGLNVPTGNEPGIGYIRMIYILGRYRGVQAVGTRRDIKVGDSRMDVTDFRIGSRTCNRQDKMVA